MFRQSVSERVKRLGERLGIAPFRPRVLLKSTLIVSASAVFACIALLGIMYLLYAWKLKPPDQAIAETMGTSAAFDRTGQNELYQYTDPFGGLRHPVPLDQMSPYLVAATVATEDPSFFHNPGVNFRGLARATIENLSPFGPGFLKGSGGSSITQQLARNIYLSQDERLDRRVQRKLKETVIALELKRRYDDKQILEWYLNQIYYGNHLYGAETASQGYFSKSAKDLTLAEATLLAGLPQAPNAYSPVNQQNQQAAKARQIEVLDLMAKHADDIAGIAQISPEQLEAAKDEPLNYVPSKFGIAAPHFVFYVEDQVKKMCAAGLFDAPNDLACDKVVAQGGLRITTTLDLGLNKIGEKVIEDKLAANEATYNGHNGALVAISPASGEILAYVGSRDFWRQDISGQVDIATSLRSHGSTMKAFNYLAAFEQGWVPSTYVQDQPLILDVGGGQERPVNNWDGAYLGQITVRKAVAESVNTAAVRTVMDVGIDKMQDMAHRLGVTDLREKDCGPTITLGACDVKLVDMTYAFSVLANNGMMRGRPSSEDLPSGFRELDPVSVLKIQDAEGKTLYEYKTPQERPILNSAYSYMLTDILSKDAIKWSALGIDRPAAVKTGTSEDFRDNVVMGYTPDLATGVWMGNTDNTPMAQGTFSSAGTGPIWKEFMLEAHHYLNLPPKNFEKPGNIVTVRCGGRDEPFEAGKKPPKAGLCAAPVPASAPAPDRTTEPPPESPTNEPSVSPTPAAASATPTAAATRPAETPGPTQKPRLTPTPIEPATPVETETPAPTPVATPSPGPGG